MYISSKIPVIEYYTLMEKILLTCFIITILNAVESGIIYILLNEKFKNDKSKQSTIINNKFNKNLKIIHNSDNKYHYKYLVIIDNCYKMLINSIFVIVISILLELK